MASPVQQIPVSAGFQAVQEKESKSEKTRGETTQKHTDEGAQETKMVNVVYCSQGDQDISQPQAQVPQAEKSSEPKAQTEIERGESIDNHKDKGSQEKTAFENSLYPQADLSLSQSQAHVPQDEKSPGPKDQEDQREMGNSALDQDTASLSLVPQVESQSSNPPQKATSPMP